MDALIPIKSPHRSQNQFPFSCYPFIYFITEAKKSKSSFFHTPLFNKQVEGSRVQS